MKKLLIVLAFAGVTTAAMAQNTDAVPTEKFSVATNSFWANWFVQVGGQWGAWYSNQEHDYQNHYNISPFKSFRSAPSIAIAVGKWFTPGLGLRTKLQGIWGKTVGFNQYNTSSSSAEVKSTNMKYALLQEQMLFNFSNMICGYNPDRVWNFIPFMGGGIGRSFTADLFAVGLSVGILNEFKVSKRVLINFELGWNRFEGDIDGDNQSNGRRGWNTHDNNMYAEVGLTFNTSKTVGWNKTPDVAALQALSKSQLDALNAQLADEKAANDKLRDQLANQKPAETITQSIKELITTPVSVFFNLGKIDVASLKDMVNVQALAKYAKENNSKILVTGYADNATGSPAINKALSEKRANTILEELVKLGINRDNISTASYGGVATLSPVSFNRRATVQITE